MSLAIVVDMNLSQAWVSLFINQGWPAVHWSDLGDARSPDEAIVEWAAANNHAVFSLDLDFSAILATTKASRPSLIQLRSRQTLPERVGGVVVTAVKQFEDELAAGALVTIDPTGSRVRILPFD